MIRSGFRNTISAVMLAILLPVFTVLPFHHHDTPEQLTSSCEQCTNHQPHHGHLTTDWNAPQNCFYGADGTETATPGYLLLNASLGTDVLIRGKKWASIYILADNLTDCAWQSHLSRLKWAGGFNMGRNFTVKMVWRFS